jgi:hypothetical protein
LHARSLICTPLFRGFTYLEVNATHSITKNAAILIGCFVFAVVLFTPAIVHGDEWNWQTRFMLSQPAEVPGLVLEPNTRYVIKVLDSPSERHVVQIYNDKSKMLTMFMCAADERTIPTDETVFTFIETQAGYPMPIKEWFYPGHLDGLEFIYPKKQARQIAAHALEPVLSGDASDLHDLATLTVEANSLKKGEVGLSTSAINFPKTDNAPVVEEKPTAPSAPQDNNVSSEPAVQEPAVIAQNNTESNLNVSTESDTNTDTTTPTDTNTETTATQVQNEEAPKELPRTAGELPLIGLIGVLCFGGGVGIRVLSSKS